MYVASSTTTSPRADHVGLGVVGVALRVPAGRWPAGCGPRARRDRRCASSDVVHAPVVGDDGEAALGDDEQHRDVGARSSGSAGTGHGRGRARGAPSTSSRSGSGASSSALPSAGRILTWWPSRDEAGQHLGRGLQRVGEQEQGAHRHPPVGEARARSRRQLGRPGRWGRISDYGRSAWPTGDEAETPWASSRCGTGPSARAAAGHRRRRRRRSTGPVTAGRAAPAAARAASGHPRFADVLGVCSVLVGDRPVGDATTRRPSIVAPGTTVEFLPPFAGG